MIDDALQLKRLLMPLIKEAVRQETQECLRVYRAVVKTAPYTTTDDGREVCDVQLTGDTTVLTLPYSTKMQNMEVGQIVLIATTYDSFQNAIVWEKPYFN